MLPRAVSHIGFSDAANGGVAVVLIMCFSLTEAQWSHQT